MPYITKSAWMDYLVTEEDVTEASAKQAMKIGVNRIANRLVESAIIKEYEMGFVVVDDAISTAMVL
jgi:methenyltetrahydromethanopterin cyclohydrolase